jgi:hypothetical protein
MFAPAKEVRKNFITDMHEVIKKQCAQNSGLQRERQS